MARNPHNIAHPAVGSVQKIEEGTCQNCGGRIIKKFTIPNAVWWHAENGMVTCPER